MENNRRNFLRNSTILGAGLLALPAIAKAVVGNSNTPNTHKVQLKKNSVVLFQGDSITDAGRTHGHNVCNNFEQLGTGYTLFTAAQLLHIHADKHIKIYNRGVSGNKVFQLRDRWEVDAIALQPDVLSILVGVNDFWHTLSHNYKGTPQIYENDLRDLLQYTKEKLPNTQLVLGEPFAIKGGAAIDEHNWFPNFDTYRTTLKKLAYEFNATFVPYQDAFDQATKIAPPRYWSNDGVHPDLPGRQLMAQVWIHATGLN
jgi:lysophospholipase L1-like esterase